jgi:hypothetical protein
VTTPCVDPCIERLNTVLIEPMVQAMEAHTSFVSWWQTTTARAKEFEAGTEPCDKRCTLFLRDAVVGVLRQLAKEYTGEASPTPPTPEQLKKPFTKLNSCLAFAAPAFEQMGERLKEVVRQPSAYTTVFAVMEDVRTYVLVPTLAGEDGSKCVRELMKTLKALTHEHDLSAAVVRHLTQQLSNDSRLNPDYTPACKDHCQERPCQYFPAAQYGVDMCGGCDVEADAESDATSYQCAPGKPFNGAEWDTAAFYDWTPAE